MWVLSWKRNDEVEKLQIEREIPNMKTNRCLLIAVIGGIAIGSPGCVNNQQSAPSANTNPTARTYTSDDLQKTGKQTPGEALQAADPSVITTTGH